MTLPLALLWLCRLRSLPWAGVAGTARSELRAGLLLGTDPHSPPAVPSPSLSPGGTRSLPVPAGSPAPGRQPGSHLRLVPPPGAVPSHALAWQAAGGGCRLQAAVGTSRAGGPLGRGSQEPSQPLLPPTHLAHPTQPGSGGGGWPRPPSGSWTRWEPRDRARPTRSAGAPGWGLCATQGVGVV